MTADELALTVWEGEGGALGPITPEWDIDTTSTDSEPVVAVQMMAV